MDNRSDFLAPLEVEVLHEGEDYGINIDGAIAIANTIAYPIAVFLGLTRQQLMTQSLRFFRSPADLPHVRLTPVFFKT